MNDNKSKPRPRITRLIQWMDSILTVQCFVQLCWNGTKFIKRIIFWLLLTDTAEAITNYL